MNGNRNVVRGVEQGVPLLPKGGRQPGLSTLTVVSSSRSLPLN